MCTCYMGRLGVYPWSDSHGIMHPASATAFGTVFEQNKEEP